METQDEVMRYPVGVRDVKTRVRVGVKDVGGEGGLGVPQR